MTARKPKPKPRKASGPTLEQRVADLEETVDVLVSGRLDGQSNMLQVQGERIAALESRASLRDKSHDEPVSNAGEAIGQHFRIVGEPSLWRRFLNFMGSP